MYYKEFNGINSFLVGMARLLLKEGVERKTRNFKCFELPSPILIKIKNPTARLITIPARNWNSTLPYVESLWLASGRNDIEMVAHYVKKMMDFSDDQITMRGGYGPRLRYFNGIADDYNNGYQYEQRIPDDFNVVEIDQFEFVEKSFKKDPLTRQAIITIGDPAKDCFQDGHILKQTKDFPCTRDIQFIKNNGKLDVIVNMRSNDFVWGAGGVNIFNFTFIQEYFAAILGLEIGEYYHIANNFHYYENLQEMVKSIADTATFRDEPFHYKKSFNNLNEFDERLMALQKYEHQLRNDTINETIDFADEFFNDWAKVFYSFKNKSTNDVNFVNPTLRKVIKKSSKSISINNREQLKNIFTPKDKSGEQMFWRSYI